MMPTTALAAMALQGADGFGPAIRRALDVLDSRFREPRLPFPLRLRSSASIFITVQLIISWNFWSRVSKPDGSWRGQAHLTSLAILALRVKEKINAFAI